jgi:Tol biopolymer transport system component
MKSSKLDRVVIALCALCILCIGIIAWLNDITHESARVVYLYPAFGGVQNVWMTDIDNPENQRQLTFSEYGIFDFDVSPDGQWLAFADKNIESATRIRLLNLSDNVVIELVDCVALDAYCTTPAFSPDGTKLAYQRTEQINGQYEEQSRIWLVDMTSPNYETNRLITDLHVVGHSPVWSADNNTLAFYGIDNAEPLGEEANDHTHSEAGDTGILVYDFVPRGDDGVQLRYIPSAHGSMGTVSPNGQQIIFPEVVNRNGQFYSYLQLADLLNKELLAFTDPDGDTDDVIAQWSPDGQIVALARRYMDERWTPGHQLYLQNTETDTLTALAYDERYNTSYFRWNSTGSHLVLQRFPLQNTDGTAVSDARPEIWVVDVKTGALTELVANAFLPQWASP